MSDAMLVGDGFDRRTGEDCADCPALVKYDADKPPKQTGGLTASSDEAADPAVKLRRNMEKMFIGKSQSVPRVLPLPS